MRCRCGQETNIADRRCPRCGRRLIAGMSALGLLVDASAAVSLLLALALVFLLSSRAQVVESAFDADEPDALIARPLRLAVTPPEFDDMGKLLDTLGSGYRYTEIKIDDLLSARRLADFDVLFLTCGGAPPNWLASRLGAGDRGSPGVFRARAEICDSLRTALRRFVGDGGTLYASDWRFQLVAIAFPEFVDPTKISRGAAQSVAAEVLDAGLRRQLGSGAIELRFDKEAWYAATIQGHDVIDLVRGKYTTLQGQIAEAPLLVELPFGKGSVIFTSFHNEAQHSEIESQLLRYLVFATITARTDAQVKQTMVRGGFSPVDRDLLSASAADQSVTQSYDCRATCDLQFVLGFENRGAELRLAVVGPDGSRQERAGSSTLSIKVPRAAPGRWQYTVTPVKVPYKNFPFTLTVGQRR